MSKIFLFLFTQIELKPKLPAPETSQVFALRNAISFFVTLYLSIFPDGPLRQGKDWSSEAQGRKETQEAQEEQKERPQRGPDGY